MNHPTDNHSVSRRRFFAAGAAGGAAIAAAGLPGNAFAHEDHDHSHSHKIQFGDEAVVLIQGDSITDAGRAKGNGAPNSPQGLGNGYARMIAAALLGEHPAKRLKVYNRGISGNKVPQLDARWQADCIDLKPDVVSILIGVNDMWHKLGGRYDGTVETYKTGFAALLGRTKKALPQVALVVCEPFVLKCGAVNDKWFPEFDQRRAAAKQVADDAGAVWVPFQKMFDDRLTEQTPPQYWARDGVHPSFAGHALMAETWMEVTGLG